MYKRQGLLQFKIHFGKKDLKRTLMDGQMDVEMFMHLEVLMQIMMLNHLVGGIILLVMVLHLIVIGWQVLEWQEVALQMTTLLVHYYG